MDELKIIQYLDGEMSAEESKIFEAEISMNPALAEEIEKFRQVQGLAQKLLADQKVAEKNPDTSAMPDLEPAMEEEIAGSVREHKSDPDFTSAVPPEYRERVKRAESIFMRNRGKPGSVVMISRIWYTAAAIVILALAVSILIFRPFSRASGNDIYAQYFRTFQGNEEILELARTDNDFLFAKEVYEAGDYERAVVLFEILADSSEHMAWSIFYAGISHMALNNTTKAIDLFQLLLQEDEDEVQSLSRWQLALCYIRTGSIGNAREQLEILLQDPSYKRDARKILRILK